MLGMPAIGRVWTINVDGETSALLPRARSTSSLSYKADRLTRSLADFARIVDTLDRAGASFVSVTQAFNTTSSMGRLKAQASCRSTLEALAKLHQSREQTVKHVHVSEGGQAVVADHFHQHRGDRENGKIDDQSRATGAAGASAALPSPDPFGNGVPVPGGSREAAMQDARRDEPRSA